MSYFLDRHQEYIGQIMFLTMKRPMNSFGRVRLNERWKPSKDNNKQSLISRRRREKLPSEHRKRQSVKLWRLLPATASDREWDIVATVVAAMEHFD